MHETPIRLDVLVFMPRLKVHKGMIVEGNTEVEVSPTKSLPVESDYAAIAYETVKYIQPLFKPQSKKNESLKKCKDYDEIPMVDFVTIPTSPFPSLPLEISASIFSHLASSISDIQLLELRAVNKQFRDFVDMLIWESVSRHLHLRRLKTPFIRLEDFPSYKVQLGFTFTFDFSRKQLRKNQYQDLVVVFVPKHEASETQILTQLIYNIDDCGLAHGKGLIVRTSPTVEYRAPDWGLMDLKDAHSQLFGAYEYLKQLTYFREGYPESFVHKINRKSLTFCILVLSLLALLGMLLLTAFGSVCYHEKTCSSKMLIIGCALFGFSCVFVAFVYRIYWVNGGICNTFVGGRDGEYKVSGIKMSDYSSCC